MDGVTPTHTDVCGSPQGLRRTEFNFAGHRAYHELRGLPGKIEFCTSEPMTPADPTPARPALADPAGDPRRNSRQAGGSFRWSHPTAARQQETEKWPAADRRQSLGRRQRLPAGADRSHELAARANLGRSQHPRGDRAAQLAFGAGGPPRERPDRDRGGSGSRPDNRPDSPIRGVARGEGLGVREWRTPGRCVRFSDGLIDSHLQQRGDPVDPDRRRRRSHAERSGTDGTTADARRSVRRQGRARGPFAGRAESGDDIPPTRSSGLWGYAVPSSVRRPHRRSWHLAAPAGTAARGNAAAPRTADPVAQFELFRSRVHLAGGPGRAGGESAACLAGPPRLGRQRADVVRLRSGTVG